MEVEMRQQRETTFEVTVVLAIYRPNVKFLSELLMSLNNQNYKDFNVLIRDDSIISELIEENRKIVDRILVDMQYTYKVNQERLGSTKTFEVLTNEAQAQYIAYCDQDDIWLPNKLERMINRLIFDKSTLCYSDISIINGDGQEIGKSIRELNPRIKHKKGNRLYKTLLYKNFVTGCSMIVDAKVAKKAIPFCAPFFIHDHWLALNASIEGGISYIKEPLTQYRIHENNQIGIAILSNISSVNDYTEIKLDNEIAKYLYLKRMRSYDDKITRLINRALKGARIRKAFLTKFSIRDLIKMIVMIPRDPQLIIFEILLGTLPQKVATVLINNVKS